MAGVASSRIDLRAGSTIGWDVPFGPADDPERYQGLAALAARYLTSTHFPTLRSRAADLGMHSKHALTARRSAFSFWSPDDQTNRVTELASCLERRPTQRDLERVRQQVRQAAKRQTADPVWSLFCALHLAAWGEDACIAINGSSDTLDAIEPDVLCAYLDRCEGEGSFIVPDRTFASHGPEPAMSPGGRRAWSPQTTVVARPIKQALVAVQFAFEDELDEVDLNIIGEALGNRRPGLLLNDLRRDNSLAYSAGSLCGIEHGRPTVAAYAVTDSKNAPRCLERIHAIVQGLNALSEQIWLDAGRRLQRRLGAEWDGPFAELDEIRSILAGEVPARLVALSAVARSQAMATRPLSPLPQFAQASVLSTDKRGGLP